MVKFAPVISSAAVARAQGNTSRTRASNVPNGRVRLPSLYPAISLKSLHGRSDGSESNTGFEQAPASRLFGQPSIDVTEQGYDKDGTSLSRELHGDENGAVPSKVKGSSIVVGAAGILRAATAIAVDNTTAETTVHQAEHQIEEPECETFVIIATRLGRQYVFRFSKEKSLYLFGPLNAVRKAIIILVTNQFFELFILLTIIINCIFLALKNAPEEPEYVFAAIYTVEMILKIIAKGFCMHKFAYLRDPWNWLDFVVVILGYITLLPNVYNLSGIRTFRVLRALRTISTVEGLKTMVNALLKSMTMLSDVLILTLFFLCIFALVGMQLFVGQLRNKCVNDPPSLGSVGYNRYIANESVWFKSSIDGPMVCGNASTAGHCPANYTCLSVGDNPNYGYTNFDNFAWSLVTAFQLITMDFWENVFNYVLASMGSWYVFYFMFVVFFGSFYLINLVLAVVAVSYQQEVVSMQERDKNYEELKAVVSSYSFHGRAVPKLLTESGKSKPETLVTKCKLSLCAPCFKSCTVSKSHETRVVNNASELDGSHTSLRYSPCGPRATEMKSVTPEHASVTDKNENFPVVKTSNKEDTQIRLPPANSIATRSKQLSSSPNNSNSEASEISNSRFLEVKPSWTTTLSIISENETLDNDNHSANGDDCNGMKKVKLPGISTASSPTVSPRSSTSLEPQKKDTKHRKEELSRRKKIQRHISKLTMDPLFDMFITFCILVNTLFLSLEYHGMNENFRVALAVGNMVFTFVFVLEMVLKLISLGPRGYVKSRWNIFDGFIVVISVVDLILELAVVGKGAGLSVLRTFRLLRVFKLAQSWETMNMLLRTIASSIGQLGNLTLVLGIIVYMLAVVGMQLFGSVYTEEKFGGDIPRWNFNDFGHACMMIFRVLCGEWIEPLYDSMRATSPVSFLFFLTALVIGNFLVLNLFLALLLNAFARESLKDDANKKGESKPSRFFQGVQRLSRVLRLNSVIQRKAQVKPSLGSQALSEDGPKPEGNSESGDVLNGTPALMNAVTAFQKKGKLNRDTVKRLSIAIEAANKDSITSSTVLSLARSSAAISSPRESTQIDPPADPAMTEVQECCPCCTKRCTCNCIAMWKRSSGYRLWRNVRHRIKKFVEHRYFEWAILVIIVASSVTLIFEDIHLDKKPTLKKVLDYLNIVFAVVFTLEFIMKTIGLGLVTYFKNAWNCLDVVIVAISILTAVESIEELNSMSLTVVANQTTDGDSSLAAFRSLRTLRALRPLRAISRWEGMKVVVNSLLFAIPGIGNVLLVCMVFWLIFSIVGVQFFGGRFYKCIDSNGERLPISIVQNKTDCDRLKLRWVNSNINFDNAANGFIALFQVATFEGWMEIMRDAVDAREVGQQPESQHRFIPYLYFVVFIIVGSFFTLNLFIGVIIDNFNRLKKQYEDSGALDIFLTPSQKAWFNTLKKAANKKPKKMISRPGVRWQAKVFDMIHSSRFETAIMAMICLNMLVMMIQHYGQSEEVQFTLNVINLVFTAIFLLEAVIRIVALRLHYFTQPWNIFDFTIVILSIIGIIVEYLDYSFIVTPSLFRVARVFRIGRLLRFYKGARGIRRLLFALVISLPALFNIGALLFLVMFIYAIIGMSSFGYVKKTGALDELVNFETFGSSMLLLFRLSTSAGWNDVLEPLLIKPPDCDENYLGQPNGNCGIPWLAILYFFTFILSTFLIIINMYIAIILENLSQAHQQDEVGITDDDLEMFYTHWERFDPNATQYILYSQLSDFVDGLEQPLRIPQPNKFACIHLNIPIKQGDRIHCFDVMQALVRRIIGEIEEEGSVAFALMKSRMEHHFVSAFPKRAKTQTESTTLKRIQEIRAATIIQRSYRQYRFQLELRRFRLQRSHQTLEHAHSSTSLRGNSPSGSVQVMVQDRAPNSAPRATVVTIGDGTLA